MSKITTLSTFYYGFTVTKENYSINFNEGAGELTAYVKIGDYTAEQYVDAVATAMTLAGTQTYTGSFNRTTRRMTISAPSNFSLLANTGSQTSVGIWVMSGYSTASDKTGANTYLAEGVAGSVYKTQMPFNKYIALEDYEVKESAVVNLSTSGIVQTLQFGDGQRMQCNIRGASNLTGVKNHNYYENVTGIQDLRNFLKYLITKAKIEFMPDADVPGTFYNLLLESSDKDKNGTSFTLKNMDGANNYYESGVMIFRKVIS